MKQWHQDWRKNWLSCINELTSIELQKVSWLDSIQSNLHWSFVEFMCCYFDDMSLDDNYQYVLKEGAVTIDEYNIIKNWHEALSQYNSPNGDDQDNNAILNDTKWLKILKLGLDAKNQLLKILNEAEQLYLTEHINYKE
jgi:hypothetical protein